MTRSHPSRPHKYSLTLLAVIAITGILLSLIQPAPVRAADPTPGPDEAQLAKNYKAASKPVLKLGETMTYTIHLEIGWSASLYGEVSDPIPVGLEYVPDSANYGGVYDPNTRTLTWTQVPVGYPKPIDLTFEVKDTAQVNRPTPVVNTATIAVNGFVFQRQAWVTLLPEPPGRIGSCRVLQISLAAHAERRRNGNLYHYPAQYRFNSCHRPGCRSNPGHPALRP